MAISPWFLLVAVILIQLPHPALPDQPGFLLPGIKIPSDFQSMGQSQNREEVGERQKHGDPINVGLEGWSGVMRVAMKHREAAAYRGESHHEDGDDGGARSGVESVLRRAMGRDSRRREGMRAKVESAGGGGAGAMAAAAAAAEDGEGAGAFPLESSVESGACLGSGEYLMDVYVGTPPTHLSLIIDTGSDLVWTQCHPCRRCYQQAGAVFTPNASSSYSPVSCSHPLCTLAHHPDPSSPCLHCRYSYWYGDLSNTTGDLATETFTLKSGHTHLDFHVPGIVFGCGHSNQGLFRGASGLLGLGRGPLSFPSQLSRRFGRKFSYCLVSRNNNLSVNSMLTFGEDQGLVLHPQVQYTKFLVNTSVDTYYYLDIAKVSVGGQDMPIPSSTWTIDARGRGGTIIDSGTTLTYFAAPAYQMISRAFVAKVSYTKVDGPSWSLDHCYNVSGLSQIEFPTISITFSDGAVLTPPVENYVIPVDADSSIFCLAILEAPMGSLSILGNYLQQNIHVLYDLEEHRLGFAPMDCISSMQR